MNNPMLDKEFLRQLDCVKHKEKYARLTSLTFLEDPIEQIEGRITGGSINLDGASSSRRTCNLTMVAKDVNINQFYWGLTHKFKLEIGLINDIDSRYDNIIWFDQGKFVITTFNVSLNTNNYTITINGKDKMSLLNGELGGTLAAQTDFGSIDSYENFYELKVFSDASAYVAGEYYVYDASTDTYSISYDPYNKNTNYYVPSSIWEREILPLKTIIREAVHTYGKEPYFNIIINDLEDCGVELLEYRNSESMYLLLDKEQNVYTNMVLESKAKTIPCHIVEDNVDTFLGDLPEGVLDTRITQLDNEVIPKTITFSNNKEYYVFKINYGDTAGFRETDLVYAGDLIGNVGETLTSILDKIKNMLGNFEYFYDTNGRFIFQKQKTYQSESWNNIVKTEDKDLLIENAATSSAVMYSFINNNLITAFNNTPNLSNLKNDYSIWGTRKTINGTEIPVHLRYAIDKKPTYYKSFDGYIYVTSLDETVREKIKTELIEDGKKDFYSFNRKENPHIAGKQQLPDDWWYMSDWFNYYKKLTNSDTGPIEYIRKYATNRSGTLIEKGYAENFDPSLYFNVTNPDYSDKKTNIWLFHLVNGNYVYGNSDQHNSIVGLSSPYHEQDDGTVTVAPFSGCTAHTYTFFIDIDEDGVAHDKENAVGFFYKPAFPKETIEQIEQVAEEAIETYANEHCIICDWREIIYQMAKDYYKHNQEEDFYSKIMLNNGRKDNGDFLYPNGSTGYEQYYIDINGFWRDLYDLDPKQSFYSQGGYYAETINWSAQNNLTFEKQVVWVPYESNDAIFSSEYYLPIDKKIYDDEIVEQMITIEETNVELTPFINDGYGITWPTLGSGFKYEIYRSFYANIGYSKVTPLSGQQSFVNGNWNYKERNLSALGADENLRLYYRIRGYKDVQLSAGTSVRVYTQWSNKCSILLSLTKNIDDDGNLLSSQITAIDSNTYSILTEEFNPIVSITEYKGNFNESRKFWNKKVYEQPETLNFWFDFLDSDSELAQFAVPVVGDRSKAVNDSKVTSIYFKEIPNIIFVTPEQLTGTLDLQPGYTYIQIKKDMENMFSISSQQKSAKDALDELLYQHAYCIESVTVTALPVYYLEPNNRIFVYDESSKINGEYIVSKISLPLAYNGTMSITATKAVNRIY